MYTKIAIFVFKFLFLALLQAKNELSPSRLLRECFEDVVTKTRNDLQ